MSGPLFLLMAIVLAAACVSSAEEWTEMRVPSGAGTVEQRVGQLERRSSGLLRFLSDDAGDSTRIVDDFLQPGQELWHTAADSTLWIVRKDIDETVLAVRAEYVETDPVFVAWKPTYVVIGGSDSSVVRTGNVQKSLKVRLSPDSTVSKRTTGIAVPLDSMFTRSGSGATKKIAMRLDSTLTRYGSGGAKTVGLKLSTTNTWSAIQKFGQGIVTEYQVTDAVSDPPLNAELQSLFGSSLDGGYLGKLYDSVTGKKYIVGKANGVFDWALVTTAL